MQTRRFLLTGAAGLAFFNRTAFARSKRSAATAVHEGQPEQVQAPADSMPATTPIGSLETGARWACIVDFDTGNTLLEKRADERMPPSSLTKMMTAYIVFAMLRTGHLSLTQKLPVSEKAWRTQGSKMFVPLGQNVSVSDLIEGMIIQSGNDACIVLAEGIAGSEERFVQMMNEAVPKLGLTNSHFENCTGLPDDDQFMTARDVSRVAIHLIRDYPEYYHLFAVTEFTFNNIKQGNRNTLVDKGLADGLKTGHTNAGGFGLCASSKREGRRVIMTINGTASMKERSREGERLLAWAFANFSNVTLVRRGEMLDRVPVYMGETATVPLVATKDVLLTLPRGWEQRCHMTIVYHAPVSAPISSGQELGRLEVQSPAGPPLSVALVASRSVSRLGFVDRAMMRLGVNMQKSARD